MLRRRFLTFGLSLLVACAASLTLSAQKARLLEYGPASSVGMVSPNGWIG